MTDGLNLDGFTAPKVNDASPWGTVSYTDAPASAFPAKDMSTQGNAGLNAEGSSSANESANDASENM